jgi:lipopolysaccharide transport system permease protein
LLVAQFLLLGAYKGLAGGWRGPRPRRGVRPLAEGIVGTGLMAVVKHDADRPSEPHRVVIEGTRGVFEMDWRELWEYRELIYFMVWRDLTTRYKQTALGIGWAVLQPVFTMLIFVMVFSRVARIPTGDIPYPLIAFTGVVPWTYFAQAVSRAGQGLIKDTNLITKVYFPRLIIPLAASITPIVDFALSFVVMTALLLWYHTMPAAQAILLPLFILMAMAAAFSFGLWFSALNVRYRDVQHIIPFFVQVGMFASPVAYPTYLIPAQWQTIYALNPMVAVIEGFRWCLLNGAAPTMTMIGMGLATIAVLLPTGYLYFKSTERTFADVI